MPLFKCDECGAVENTACCNYWLSQRDGGKALCSECDPEIKAWHGIFPKRSAVGMLIDQNGHLWDRKTVETDQLPDNYRIVGEVLA